jgi:hypothetical protein
MHHVRRCRSQRQLCESTVTALRTAATTARTSNVVYLRGCGPKGIEVVDLVCNKVTVERMSTTPGNFSMVEKMKSWYQLTFGANTLDGQFIAV